MPVRQEGSAVGVARPESMWAIHLPAAEAGSILGRSVPGLGPPPIRLAAWPLQGGESGG
jgi:hypothetical protein